jgi:hypothetical protein
MATINWSATALTGNMDTAANWQGGVAPIITDTAAIEASTNPPDSGTCHAATVQISDVVNGGTFTGTTYVLGSALIYGGVYAILINIAGGGIYGAQITNKATFDNTNWIYVESYATAAAAAQLVTDKAAVSLQADKILSDATILTINGTLHNPYLLIP